MNFDFGVPVKLGRRVGAAFLEAEPGSSEPSAASDGGGASGVFGWLAEEAAGSVEMALGVDGAGAGAAGSGGAAGDSAAGRAGAASFGGGGWGWEGVAWLVF
jgi:hypothetical protein